MLRADNKSDRGIVNTMLIVTFFVISLTLTGQSNKKYIREGNREYEKNKYPDSEILYRKAIETDKQSPDAVFNVGDALYKQKKYDEAGKLFIENANMNEDATKRSAGLYNLGNSLLMANKLEESIKSYKNALKLRPDNMEAKYNLGYAQDLLRQQQEEQKKQQQQDKDKNDQNKDNKDKKDDQNKDDDNKDQQKEQDKDQNKEQQQQQQQQSMSQEDAQRVLNALANDEKKVQEKVKLAKAAKTKVRTEKNW